MKSSINTTTSTDYAQFRKEALTLIGDLRHCEQELKRMKVRAAELDLPFEGDTEIGALSVAATVACEKQFDLAKSEEVAATMLQVQNTAARSKRTFIGRMLDKAASFAG